MSKDRDFLHWKLWRFTVDWFTDCGDWFLYFRYWKPRYITGLCGTHSEVFEVRFSSAGFMTSSYYF